MSAAAGEDPSQREDVVSQILPPQRRKSAETEPGAFTVRQQVLAKRFERSALFSADPCGDAALARPTAKNPARGRSLPPDLLPLARGLVVARETKAAAPASGRAEQLGKPPHRGLSRVAASSAASSAIIAALEERPTLERERDALATRSPRRADGGGGDSSGVVSGAAAAGARSRSRPPRGLEPLHEARELADDVQAAAPRPRRWAPRRTADERCALAPLRAVLRWFNSLS